MGRAPLTGQVSSPARCSPKRWLTTKSKLSQSDGGLAAETCPCRSGYGPVFAESRSSLIASYSELILLGIGQDPLDIVDTLAHICQE
jgi:hypothetical protein